MRIGTDALAAILGCSLLAMPASAATEMEQQVLAALNAARADPARYGESLRTYRTYFRANTVRYPGHPDDVETAEGVHGVDEAIEFVARQSPLTPIEESPVLKLIAGDLVTDQSTSGDTGHEASDGSMPGDRARRRGGGPYVAEVVAYGPIDAADAIRQLIVDDGVADRGHRAILYAAELRYAGVVCGPHPDFRTMCVIDLAITPDGKAYRDGAKAAERRTNFKSDGIDRQIGDQ